MKSENTSLGNGLRFRSFVILDSFPRFFVIHSGLRSVSVNIEMRYVEKGASMSTSQLKRMTQLYLCLVLLISSEAEIRFVDLFFISASVSYSRNGSFCEAMISNTLFCFLLKTTSRLARQDSSRCKWACKDLVEKKM